MFGLIGWFNGNLQISVLSSQYQLNDGIFINVGTFGLINGTSSSYNNIIVQTQIQNNSGLCVGALAGVIYSNLWKAQNISVDLSYITGNRLLGLLASSTTTGSVFECHFASSFIYANQQDQTFQGGIIGSIQSNEQIQLVIILCQVTNLSLLSNNNFTWSISGGLVGDTHANPAQITQTTVKDLDIQSYGEVRDYVSSASLIACVYDSVTSITDVYIKNISVIASSSTKTAYSAGIISSVRNQKINVTNTQIVSIQIVVQGNIMYSGILFGNSGGSANSIFNISLTKTSGVNTINGTSIANCADVITYQLSGC
ncbi:Hypothetical_protein [Hexamita inflata]|uniref:Hypothetical_protein n=1 Tax=Hexamita inflata TaxID=28002 RepID=A0AA86U497_9EUKA|nr:Hypothetical protein HINF_LOCUS27809 [Hexamita inflata]